MKPSVQFFVVCAPGVDPGSVEVKPEIVKLGWKFAQFDKGDLIDQLKLVDEHVKSLTKWCEAAKGVLKQVLPVPTPEAPELITAGRRFEAHYIYAPRVDVDRDKVKAFVGEDRYVREFCKTTPVYTLKIVPISQTPGVAG